jgi:hydroxyacylglutathione hydrolase
LKSQWVALAIATNVLCASTAWGALAPGSMDVHWDPGAKTCEPSGAHAPIQVHRFNAQTFILRENLCSTWEAPFVYLLVGGKQALLIDTGDVADPSQMPLKMMVFSLLSGDPSARLPLLVVHSHAHLDHREGDSQFAELGGVTLVPSDLEHVRQFFGLSGWPRGTAQVDLGDRVVDVIPAPGHDPAHVVYYDRNTGLVFSGDFLLPGRLLVSDFRAYDQSAQRIAAFFKERPVSYVLGGHIEKNRDGDLLPWQSTEHLNEHALALFKSDLLMLPAVMRRFNGFYTNTSGVVIENPLHNLALAVFGVLLVLSALGLSLYKLLLRRRARKRV